VDSAQQLAQFLRARRGRVKPEDVGIADGDRRRVPGLRREELAMLAGLSADYYMRLEQGRDHRPSARVLEALARALRLDDDATDHLFALSRPASPGAQRRQTAGGGVGPQVQALLDAWSTPAFVHGRRLDVLASNAPARALTRVAESETNMLRSFFLGPEDHGRYEDVEFTLARVVAYFRANVGRDLDDLYFKDLVEELSLKSDEFCRLWAKHDVLSALSGEDLYLHPVVGVMRVRFQTFAVGGTDGQTLVAVTAAPGSRDAEALAQLVTLTAERDNSISAPARLRPVA
jgi:transcriptional regulator with XRE-family HTH domain